MARAVPTNAARSAMTIALAAVTLVFCFLVWWATRTQSVPPTAQEDSTEPRLALSAEEQVSTTEDTDADGLLDWEESLWGTDQNNPDSDGDGYLDGDEVRNGGSPSVLGGGAVAPDAKAIASSTPRTATEAVTRELISSLTTALSTGELTPEEEERFITEALQQAQGALNLPEYRGEGLTMVSDSPASYAAYEAGLRTIFTRGASTTGNEVALLLEMTQGDRRSAAAKLKVAAEEKARVIEELKYVTVPSTLLSAHTELIASLGAYVVALEALSGITQDPIRATAALGQFETIRVRTERAILSLFDLLYKDRLTSTSTPPTPATE